MSITIQCRKVDHFLLVYSYTYHRSLSLCRYTYIQGVSVHRTPLRAYTPLVLVPRLLRLLLFTEQHRTIYYEQPHNLIVPFPSQNITAYRQNPKQYTYIRHSTTAEGSRFQNSEEESEYNFSLSEARIQLRMHIPLHWGLNCARYSHSYTQFCVFVLQARTCLLEKKRQMFLYYFIVHRSPIYSNILLLSLFFCLAVTIHPY